MYRVESYISTSKLENDIIASPVVRYRFMNVLPTFLEDNPSVCAGESGKLDRNRTWETVTSHISEENINIFCDVPYGYHLLFP